MTPDFAANDRVALSIDEAGVAHVRMIRADKLNALDDAMIDALIAAGDALAGMAALRCVVLSGEGRAFCAGLDLAAMGGMLAAGGLDLVTRSHGNANRFQQVAVQWRKLPVPVIAAIHGVCFGGGVQIAAGAEIRIVPPRARLAGGENKMGIVPDMGLFALLRGTMRDDALRELTYTARELSGSEGQALGLVTRLEADPLAAALMLAAEIASRNPDAVRAAKRLFNAAADQGFDAILLAEAVEQEALLGSANQREAVAAGLQKRPARFGNPGG
ncbi:MAG TPA: crotonase/enoyl-CoA hydratase family protein [Novosphingobium sp.]|nr:crotonase/enoyl-CoA hydratase family protein [Novosphingobium sp.]